MSASPSKSPPKSPRSSSKRSLEDLERADTFHIVAQSRRGSVPAVAEEEAAIKPSSATSSPSKKPKSPKKKKSSTEEMIRSVPKPAAAGARTAQRVSQKRVGAHLSVSGGLHHALQEAVRINANAVAIFTKNQRTWKASPITKEAAETFKATMKETAIDPEMILPHGSYLINLCSPDEGLEKSRLGLLDELKRCEALGIRRYNLHPGSTRGELSKEEGLRLVAESVNWALERTKDVTIVLENTAGGGYTIGRSFDELAKIIEMVKDKSRVGVCLDTCHMFAAGYDVRTAAGFTKTMDEFDKLVGFKFLKGVHLNDSKSELGTNKDRHENIGKGCIGLECFRALMNDSRFDLVPLILETPANGADSYAKEIQLLRSMEKL